MIKDLILASASTARARLKAREFSARLVLIGLEGRGVQLFERIEGDHFAILGLPLLELLRFLRDRGEVAS